MTDKLRIALDRLVKLKAELVELPLKIEGAKVKLANLEHRNLSLRGSYFTTGEIGIAKRDVRNESLPVFETNLREEHRRIVQINDKYVVLRPDNAEDNDVIEFSIDTGLKKGTRKNTYMPEKINVDEAKSIWKAHLAANETP